MLQDKEKHSQTFRLLRSFDTVAKRTGSGYDEAGFHAKLPVGVRGVEEGFS